ncbi:uncharacterized protein UDID_18664 [Ustilago sp. UG-2017a]|nr:uncharacterized protein UDID_18664 [Ustilago sp. UG-2017a]
MRQPSATSSHRKKCAMSICFVLLKCCGSLVIAHVPEESLYSFGIVGSRTRSSLYECSAVVPTVMWIADIFGSDWFSSRRNMDVHSISLAVAANATYSASTELFATVS